MVLSQSLIALLARDGREIHVLAPPSTAPLAERMPGVAATHVLPLGHGALGLSVRRQLAASLRDQCFEQAIVLPNTWKSALVPWFAGIVRRTGWRGEWRYGLLNDLRVLDETRLARLVDRYAALADADETDAPPPALVADAKRTAELVEALALPTARVLAICPGAEYGPAKRWPARHFGAVAVAYARTGGSVWLLGTAGDAPFTAEILRIVRGALPDAPVADLAGRTSLLDAVDLLATVDAVVTNDSGSMHVACALGKRVIAVYGSTSPDFTPPLDPAATIVREPPPCAPCFERVCPLGHTRCLEELAPDRVIRLLAA
jgi:heptosyltransferase-2